MKSPKGNEERNFEIDLVYNWINGNDPEWRAKRNAFLGITEVDTGANCKGRYADNDELKFSLRAVEQYAPWIRNIIILNDSQTPEWLDTSHPKIRLVNIADILPPESMPCYNSVSIEHCLHKIPGLAEHFLYANDDMFFNRPVAPSDFFTADGKPIMRLVRRPMRAFTIWFEEKIQKKQISHYTRTIMIAARLVQQKTGKFIGDKPHHNIDAFTKSQYRETFETFSEAITPTLANHFRTEHDVQRAIYSYYPLATGQAVVEHVGQDTSFRLHIHRHDHYPKYERYSPMLFCINDSQFASDYDRTVAKEWLEKRFPLKSSFEK